VYTRSGCRRLKPRPDTPGLGASRAAFMFRKQTAALMPMRHSLCAIHGDSASFDTGLRLATVSNPEPTLRNYACPLRVQCYRHRSCC
jgi:hypothetical protein